MVGEGWNVLDFYGQVPDPVVFSTINSDDNNQPMVTRQQMVGINGVEIRLQAEMAVSVPGPETVGILAISRGENANSMI
jgi:hypothetical protein